MWRIDSAAIGDWHTGKKPDTRALATMEKHNLMPYTNKARQVRQSDFSSFDYIFGMDTENIVDLKGMAPANCSAKILLLGDFDPKGVRIIRDPYYDRGSEGFEDCYVQCVRSCKSFFEKANNNQSI